MNTLDDDNADEHNPFPTMCSHFFAWSAESRLLDALVAVLQALEPVRTWGPVPTGPHSRSMERKVSLAEALDRLRADYRMNEYAIGQIDFGFVSGRLLDRCWICACTDRLLRQAHGPIEASPSTVGHLYPDELRLVRNDGARRLDVEAAIACHIAMVDMEDILLRICTSDTAITTGGCRSWSSWEPPLDMGATYHADGYVARDLALSWILLVDKTPWNFNLAFELGLPIEVLRKRVDATHTGATIPLPRRGEPLHRGEITREQVLAALDTPPRLLLEALEVSAVPDTEWQAVEPAARHYLIEGEKHTSATMDVDVSSLEHRRFIEQHAPYHVRRLPNGGVMLATHPYRTLWPLWADALALLGIRPPSA
jgi:hypothetical protein